MSTIGKKKNKQTNPELPPLACNIWGEICRNEDSDGKGRDFRAASVPSDNPWAPVERGPRGAYQERKPAREPRGSRKRVARRGRWGAGRGRGSQNTEREIRGRGCRPAVRLRRASGRGDPPISQAPRPSCPGVMGEERLFRRIPSEGARACAQAHCAGAPPPTGSGAAVQVRFWRSLGSPESLQRTWENRGLGHVQKDEEV